ncbi:MAG: tRNA (adenosine(37)-N6)-dimethylallyltransferase MiaA [Ruminococcus sp.]|nr:tRNA (adenosine(37)-N6)-dimethylallyltransferase MiaA [Ruminococcus sp.]
MNQPIQVISVVGPTASGKTRLAVELAKHFNGEIISADSMQIYQGMAIATAKPTQEEMQGIPHHLIDFLPPDQTYSVALFVRDAARCIEEITARGRLPIIAGGTGLYVDSLLNHVQFSEEQRDEAYAAQLRAELLQNGVEPLLQRLWEVDAASARRLSAEKNPKRIIRALEFYHTTGTTITEQLAQSRQTPSPYRAVKLGLNFKDREKLYDRINRRVDQMLAQGLIEEAQRVLASPLSCTSVMAIGYKELMPYFQNEATLEECIEKLKRETRRYAKRQLTWFRRDKEIHWLYADEYDSFEELYAAAVQTINEGLVYG